jgi:ABC-type transport system involved in multi-copper enzyme maturation permease subunit
MRAILKRELVTLLRRWWPLLLLTLAWLGCAGLTLIIIHEEDLEILGLALPAVVYGCACVMLPGLAGVAIVSERHNDTLTLLRAAPIRPIALLAAKFIAVFAPVVLLIIALLPIAAVPAYYGFLAPVQVLIALAVTLSTCGMLIAIGLLCSAAARSTLNAVVGSYAGAFVLLALIPFVAAGIAQAFGIYPDEESLLWALSSISLHIIYFEGFYYLIAPNLTPIYICLGWQSILTLLCLVLTWRRLCRLDEEHVAPATPRRRLWKRSVARRRTFKPIADYRNPVLAKDLALGRFTQRRWLLLAPLAVCAALVGWGMFIVSFDDFYDIHEPMTLFPFLAILFAPAFAAGAWIRELGGATLDQLSTTTMRPAMVARAKLAAASTPVLAMALGILGGAAVLWGLERLGVGALEPQNVKELTRHFLPTALPRLLGMICLTAIALLGASFTRHATPAVLAAYGSVLLVLAAFPAITYIFELLDLYMSINAGLTNEYENILAIIPGGLFLGDGAGVIALVTFANLVWLTLAYALLLRSIRRQFTGQARA